MANYATLKAAIADAIKQNGNNEITGNLLQQQLLAMVNSLGAAYQYAGVATPETNPGTPDYNVFYICSTPGTYANMGEFVVANGEVCILKYAGAWVKDSTNIATAGSINEQVNGLKGMRVSWDYLIGRENDLIKTNKNNFRLGFAFYDGTEAAEPLCAYVKIPLNGYPFLYLLALDVYCNTDNGGCFLDSQNSFISNIPYNAYNVVTGGYLPFSVPSNAAYVCINFNIEKIDCCRLYGTFPQIEFPKNLIGFDLSKISSCELADKTEFGRILAYVNSSQQWQYSPTTHTTALYPCVPGDVFRVSNWAGINYPPSAYSRNIVLFDSYGQIYGTETIGTATFEFTVPSGVSFIAFIFEPQRINDISIKRIGSGSNVELLVQQGTLWNGKTWAALGDSITEDAKAVLSQWKEKVCNKTGLSVVNLGIGSTCFAIVESGYYLNDKAMCQDIRLNAVKATDADVVTIQGGTNDCANDIPLGDVSEYTKALAQKNKNTFRGALSFVIENLLTWKPSIRMVVLTANYGGPDDGASYSSLGLTFADYSDVMVEAAKFYGLPCVDLHAEQGINALTYNYYTSDGIHWNENGGKNAASLVVSKLNQINNV